jgi:hypothetical protein
MIKKINDYIVIIILYKVIFITISRNNNVNIYKVFIFLSTKLNYFIYCHFIDLVKYF